MVPKVNKFDFYFYETVEGKLIQLIGEATEHFNPSFLKENQIAEIVKRAKLCQVLSSIEFRIDSYGLINFFVDHDDELEDFKLMKKLLLEYNDIASIEYIEKSLCFLEVNIELIEGIKSYPDDYEIKHDSLESQINFKNTLSESTLLIDSEIRKRPSDFCFDENGKPINPKFCGKLQGFYTNGKLKHEYNFFQGRAHGEGLDFYSNGRKESLNLFENGRKVRTLKRWDIEGYEK